MRYVLSIWHNHNTLATACCLRLLTLDRWCCQLAYDTQLVMLVITRTSHDQLPGAALLTQAVSEHSHYVDVIMLFSVGNNLAGELCNDETLKRARI